MRKLSFVLTILLLCGCARFGLAQISDISGTWEGYQLQQKGGPFERYDYAVTLVQKGDKVVGISYCAVEGVSIKMKFVGIVRDGMLWFEETEIYGDPYIPEFNMEWCRLKGGLKIMTDGDKAFMLGTYEGFTRESTCIPGSAYLEKKVKRA